MGIYDRDYYRNQDPQGISLSGQWTAVGTIVFLNVVVYLLISLLFGDDPTPAFNYLALHFTLFERVAGGEFWSVTQLLTHGFLHGGIMHILLNMFMLWMFGRDIEVIYGKRMFFRLYLSLIVLAGLFWVITERYILPHSAGIPEIGGMWDIPAVGASGAVAGVFLIFVFHFPKRTLFVMGILPMPAWMVGTILLGIDMFGFHQAAAGTSSTNIAHAAHIGGALFGYIFYRWHWTLLSFLPSAWFSNFSHRRKTKLRVVRPMEEEDLDAKVDRILTKISRFGADSLTDEEYRTLEAASRRAQRRRGAPMD